MYVSYNLTRNLTFFYPCFFYSNESTTHTYTYTYTCQLQVVNLHCTLSRRWSEMADDAIFGFSATHVTSAPLWSLRGVIVILVLVRCSPNAPTVNQNQIIIRTCKEKERNLNQTTKFKLKVIYLHFNVICEKSNRP